MPSNGADEDAAELRRLKCWDRRVAGYSIREISAEVGLSVSTVHKHIQTVLERIRTETDEKATQHVVMSLQRLDRAINRVMRRIEDDDDDTLEAIDRLDKLERRRAALLGLDAPEKHELDVVAGVTTTPADAARLVREKFGQHAAKPEPDAK